MVITDKFVFVHEPKTGGTFVRKALYDLHHRSRPRGILSLILNRTPKGTRSYHELSNYHGTCHDIPKSESHKPILSIVRNPFDLYVSFFYFGWWRTHPEDSYDDIELVKRQFESFPHLSFEDFLILANTRFDDFQLIGHNNMPHDERPGWYTTRFVRYYFRNPETVYPLINDEYIASKRYRNDMFNVHFMRTHNLNEDLYRYLLSMDFSSSEVKFVLDMERLRPEEEEIRRPDYDWTKYYTPKLNEYVLKKEKLLFSIFSDLSFDHAPRAQDRSRSS